MAWGWEYFDHFVQELWCACDVAQSRDHAALFSLGLGIGGNTAIFSLIDTVMIKSLPVKEPSQLVLFGDGLDEGISDGFPNPWLYSYPFCREMQRWLSAHSSPIRFSRQNRL